MSNIRHKDVFQHAIRTLAHPFSLLSMAVLFFNDYYLRIAYPSWLTGKLGDFAWLFFFPIFLTALLVWVLPKKWLKGNTPILIGSGITALVFTLGKTVPAVLSVISNSIEFFVPWQVVWVIDPTDLIALPMLGLVVLLWVKLPEPRAVQHTQLKWLWMTGALLLTMGNSAAPPTGIACVDVVDGEIYVRENYGVYQGFNGGTEWELVSAYNDEQYQVDNCSPGAVQEPIQHITFPENSDIQYRFNTGKAVERSDDGGETWKTEYTLDTETEAIEAAYYRGKQTGYDMDIPHDADFDPETGNLVMAMMFDGLLIRTIEGDYEWVPISNYFHQVLNLAVIISLLIPGDIAFTLFLGAISAGTFRWKASKWVWKAFLILLLAGVLFVGFVFQPARYFQGYMQMPILLAVVVGGVTALTLFVITMIKAKHRFHIVMTTAVVILLHTCPLLLWGYNIIPKYHIAFGIGVALSVGWTVFSHFQYAKMKESTAIEKK